MIHSDITVLPSDPSMISLNSFLLIVSISFVVNSKILFKQITPLSITYVILYIYTYQL